MIALAAVIASQPLPRQTSNRNQFPRDLPASTKCVNNRTRRRTQHQQHSPRFPRDGLVSRCMILRFSLSLIRHRPLIPTLRLSAARHSRPHVQLRPLAVPAFSSTSLIMSDSESQDDFQIDDSGSDDFVVAKPKKAAPKKAAAAPSKPAKVSFQHARAFETVSQAYIQAQATKKAPAAKKQPLASKKNAPNDSISEVDESDVGATPAKKSQAQADDGMDVDVENSPVVKAPGKQKSASEMYQKVLPRPSLVDCADPAAIATGARSEAARLVHWLSRSHYTNDVGVR